MMNKSEQDNLDDQEDMENNIALSRKECNLMNDSALNGGVSSSSNSINHINIDNLFVREYETKIGYKDYLAITQDYATMHIDEEALNVVESFGYPRSFVKESIRNGDINHATVAYHLLVNN